MKVKITFILPTLNRRKFVKRAIDSCLECENSLVKPQVIVIDSQSEDGTFSYLKGIYKDDKRVRLLQNKKTDGYMETSFQGVNLVETEYATFMFDDDVLSPYYKDMIAYLGQSENDFIMGYGEMFDVQKVMPFKEILEFKQYQNLRLLLGYFGSKDIALLKSLPVSEMCCVVSIDILRAWIIHVKEFAQQNKLREYLMLKKNIGPDLMLYFLAILGSKEVPVASAVIAQFSKHPDSMSIRYKTINITVGYWLPRIWAFERLCEKGYRKEATVCASYLISSGINILYQKIRYLDFSFLKCICFELLNILCKIYQQRIVVASFRHRISFLIETKIKSFFQQAS